MSSSNGIACPNCFHGAFGAASRAQPVLIKPCTGGMAIKDGRGYGPYNKGYYVGAGRVDMPFGPNCEHLGPGYDFTLGPNGSYIPPGPPRLRLPVGATTASAALHGALGLTDSTRNALAAGGLLLAAVGLGFAIWKSEQKPPRRRGRGRRRYATSF